MIDPPFTWLVTLEAHGCANEVVVIDVAVLGFNPFLSSSASYALR